MRCPSRSSSAMHSFGSVSIKASGGMLRLPSAVLGVATVVLVYLLARELCCRRVAWFSALVACVMPVLVVYSQEYRTYSLLIFLTALSGWSLAAALRTNRPVWWCVFVGSTIREPLYPFRCAERLRRRLLSSAVACILLKAQKREPVKPTIVASLMAFAVIGIAYVPALPRLARSHGVEVQGNAWPGARLGCVQARLRPVSGVWRMAWCDCFGTCHRRHRLVRISLPASSPVSGRNPWRFRRLIS